MSIYIKKWKCSSIQDGAVIELYLSNRECCKGKIYNTEGGKGFFVAMPYVLYKIGLKDPFTFFASIVGGENVYPGAWPFVQGKDNLIKVLNALTYYRADRIPESQKVIISDEEKRKPFTLSIRSKYKQINLNFKL